MNLKLKFGVNEDVYFLNKKTFKIQKDSIEKMIIVLNRPYGGSGLNPSIRVWFNSQDKGEYNLDELFATKEEAISSLITPEN